MISAITKASARQPPPSPIACFHSVSCLRAPYARPMAFEVAPPTAEQPGITAGSAAEGPSSTNEIDRLLNEILNDPNVFSLIDASPTSSSSSAPSPPCYSPSPQQLEQEALASLGQQQQQQSHPERLALDAARAALPRRNGCRICYIFAARRREAREYPLEVCACRPSGLASRLAGESVKRYVVGLEPLCDRLCWKACSRLLVMWPKIS